MKVPKIMDIPYKYVRKRIPPGLYIKLQSSIGRRKAYYSSDYYLNIAARYEKNIPIRNKTILEIGPGNEIAVAILMVLLGAREVYLVDKISGNPFASHGSSNDEEYAEKYLRIFQQSEQFHDREPAVSLPGDILAKIHQIDSFFTAPELPELMRDVKADCIVSNFVLEHINDLETVFINMNRILRDDGVIYHQVDLSDHTYHVFTKYKSTIPLFTDNILLHLEYSDSTWSLLDDHKCIPMNRRTLPCYLDLCDKYGFRVDRLKTTLVDKSFHVHRDVVNSIAPRYRTPEFLNLSSFELRAVRDKPGKDSHGASADATVSEGKETNV
ncbi:MAG: methyltransferase domain-containing protein [Candidatus Glassbacteria bacterium]